MKEFNVTVALLKGKEGIEKETIRVEAKNKEAARRIVQGPEPIDYVKRSKSGIPIASKRIWFNTWPHFPQTDVVKRIVGIEAL